jgi:hypothetical protein
MVGATIRKQGTNMNSKKETMKTYAIRFTDSEVEDIRDYTKVEAVAPAVRSIVLKKIEEYKAESAK